MLTEVGQFWTISARPTIGCDRTLMRKLVSCPGGIMAIRLQGWATEQH